MIEYDIFLLIKELSVVINTLFYGITSAFFSYFLIFCFGIENFECVEGKAHGVIDNIFSPYGYFITCMYCRNKKTNKGIAWLMKPLGVCIYCFASWVCICFWIMSGLEAESLLPMLGTCFVAVLYLKARY